MPFAEQVAVGPYNLDFVVFGDVAVEVHSAKYNPATHPRLADRLVKLLDAGWSVGYLWGVGHAGCDDLIGWAQSVRGNVAGRGQYRVVRGDGEVVPVGRDEIDERASVAPARNTRHILPRPGDVR